MPPPATITKGLLAHFDQHRRDLPWRKTRNPWAILVSEIMLQQTRVEVVRKIFPGFLARYPQPAPLAEAGDDELIQAWRGLGYYRRARLLREAAKTLVSEHGGKVPSQPGALVRLPGVGPYTAGALASIAFGQAEIAVDGNVERVVARHRCIELPLKSGPGRRILVETLRSWLCHRRPGDFNQALMELGATLCRPRAPICEECPLRRSCLGRRRGLLDRLPVLPARRSSIEVQARAILLRDPSGRVLGLRLPEGGINGGQVDLPGPGLLSRCARPARLRQVLRSRHGLELELGEVAARIRHGITHHRIRLTVHWATLIPTAPPGQARRRPRLRAPLLYGRPGSPGLAWTTTARKVFVKTGLAVGER